MIPPKTVEEIKEASQVEEVVSEFVSLKKRGANMIGLCPFHNEKTPSFYVSPTKGLYKCFGCGKAGNAIGFLMEHEQFTYPEALRYLAKKYSIPIEEIHDEEGKQKKLLHDSLYIVMQFANDYFINNLWERPEGRNIGLSYFKERGFREDTVKEFELGFSLDSYDHFLNLAKAKGYQVDYLKRLGLVKEKNERVYDFFRDRVMFPIHNLSGKVIAFGARTLKKDKKIPKYLNSPETDIYVKSKVLYGIYQARRAINQEDNCYLVEGYTDVISMHQAGIKNVVASSGTSLTVDQIRLIKRYTPNVHILYDGDAAGVKAALRGLDLVLEQGMNVKVVLLPDGEDPDSFVQSQGLSGFNAYVAEQAKDFILFKTHLLLEEAGEDPVKKAGLIKNIVESIARIPDPIKRALYIRECSQLLNIQEAIIIRESNKMRTKSIRQQEAKEIASTPKEPDTESKLSNYIDSEKLVDKFNALNNTEKYIIRLLLKFGTHELEEGILVADYIISEISQFEFTNPEYIKIIEIFKFQVENNNVQDEIFFYNNDNDDIRDTSIKSTSSQFFLSENWKKHLIFPPSESDDDKIEKASFDLINRYISLYLKNINSEELAKMKLLQKSNDKDKYEKITSSQLKIMQINKWKSDLAKRFGTVILW